MGDEPEYDDKHEDDEDSGGDSECDFCEKPVYDGDSIESSSNADNDRFVAPL